MLFVQNIDRNFFVSLLCVLAQQRDAEDAEKMRRDPLRVGCSV